MEPSVAVLVKPAVWRSRSRRAVVDRLTEQGAVVLGGSTIAELRTEIARLPAGSTIAACGGDGTVHLAVNAIAQSDRRLAIVPLGTGNDIARHFGIPRGAKAAAHVRPGPAATVQIDLGLITTGTGTRRYYAGVASCGFDARVNERANRYRGPSGTAKYLVALAGELSALAPTELEITDASGRRQQAVTMVAVGNTSSYGGGMRVCPAARADDGWLHVTTVDPVSRRLLVRVLPRVFNGSHVRHPAVTVSETQAMHLSGDAFPVYADGERVGSGPVTIEVVPRALRLVVPGPAGDRLSLGL